MEKCSPYGPIGTYSRSVPTPSTTSVLGSRMTSSSKLQLTTRFTPTGPLSSSAAVDSSGTVAEGGSVEVALLWPRAARPPPLCLRALSASQHRLVLCCSSSHSACPLLAAAFLVEHGQIPQPHCTAIAFCAQTASGQAECTAFG